MSTSSNRGVTSDGVWSKEKGRDFNTYQAIRTAKEQHYIVASSWVKTPKLMLVTQGPSTLANWSQLQAIHSGKLEPAPSHLHWQTGANSKPSTLANRIQLEAIHTCKQEPAPSHPHWQTGASSKPSTLANWSQLQAIHSSKLEPAPSHPL